MGSGYDKKLDAVPLQQIPKIEQPGLVREKRSFTPIVTIDSFDRALEDSRKHALQRYRPEAADLSFWTDASLAGPRTRARVGDHAALKKGLYGICVVHHRWDVQMPKPWDPLWTTTWWLSGYIGVRVTDIWQAEAIGVLQALKLAIDHCERVSGRSVTPGRPAWSLKPLPVPLPKWVNIFSDHQKVLRSVGGAADLDRFPENTWIIATANLLISRLSTFDVRVNLRWVPGHSGDRWNCWAHEGAKIALTRLPYTKPGVDSPRRVMIIIRRDRTSLESSSLESSSLESSSPHLGE